MAEQAGLVYKTVKEIHGPILFVENIKGISYNEIVRIRTESGYEVSGSVLEVSDNWAMVQCFGNTSGMDLNVSVRFTGETQKIPVTNDLIGRVFSGNFEPRDGMPTPLSDDV